MEALKRILSVQNILSGNLIYDNFASTELECVDLIDNYVLFKAKGYDYCTLKNFSTGDSIDYTHPAGSEYWGCCFLNESVIVIGSAWDIKLCDFSFNEITSALISAAYPRTIGNFILGIGYSGVDGMFPTYLRLFEYSDGTLTQVDEIERLGKISKYNKVSGNYYLTREDTGEQNVRIFKLNSQEKKIEEIGYVTLENSAADADVDSSGEYLFCVDHGGKFYVFNMSDLSLAYSEQLSTSLKSCSLYSEQQVNLYI